MVGVYIAAGIAVLVLAWGIVTIIARETRTSGRIPFDPNLSTEDPHFWVDTDPGDDNRFI
jgi:hypothetical protein